jgi:hypothetical protein
VYGGNDPAFPHRFVDGQGQEQVRLSSGGSWISRSDARLKCEIRPIPYGLAELRRLEPRTYQWRQPLQDTSASPAPPPSADQALSPSTSPGQHDPEAPAATPNASAAPPARQLGLLAQEVRQVLPELVADVGPNGELGLDYTGLLPVLIRAVQELDARLNRLEPVAAEAPPAGDGVSAAVGHQRL